MRWGEIREHVEPRLDQGCQPQGADEAGERGDNARIAQRRANNGGKHGVFLIVVVIRGMRAQRLQRP